MFLFQESDEGKVASVSESVLNQMENFAAKLLNDEISVYTKRKLLSFSLWLTGGVVFCLIVLYWLIHFYILTHCVNNSKLELRS